MGSPFIVHSWLQLEGLPGPRGGLPDDCLHAEAQQRLGGRSLRVGVRRAGRAGQKGHHHGDLVRVLRGLDGSNPHGPTLRRRTETEVGREADRGGVVRGRPEVEQPAVILGRLLACGCDKIPGDPVCAAFPW